MRLFHYTTIDTLAYMMSNRSIRFGRLDTLDDKTESEQFAAFNPLKYIFSCSFTDDPKESILHREIAEYQHPSEKSIKALNISILSPKQMFNHL